MEQLTVSELAQLVGTTPDTLRYYERIGLLRGVERSPSGYRLFDDDDAERVRFIKRAQKFGLQLDEIRELLDIRERGMCPCGHVRSLLNAKLGEIAEQIETLGRLRDDITRLMEQEAAGEGCWPCGSGLVQISKPPKERR